MQSSRIIIQTGHTVYAKFQRVHDPLAHAEVAADGLLLGKLIRVIRDSQEPC